MRFYAFAVPVALRRIVAECSANGADHCACQRLGSDGILDEKGPLSLVLDLTREKPSEKVVIASVRY